VSARNREIIVVRFSRRDTWRRETQCFPLKIPKFPFFSMPESTGNNIAVDRTAGDIFKAWNNFLKSIARFERLGF